MPSTNLDTLSFTDATGKGEAYSVVLDHVPHQSCILTLKKKLFTFSSLPGLYMPSTCTLCEHAVHKNAFLNWLNCKQVLS